MGEKLKSWIKEEKFSLKIAQTGHNTCIDYKDYISGGGGRRQKLFLEQMRAGPLCPWAHCPLMVLQSKYRKKPKTQNT